MQIQLIDESNNIYSFLKDSGNFIEFCPDRGGLITRWISDNKSILYFDQNRFLDKTKSNRGGIPILFPICGSLDSSFSLFGKNCSQIMQHGFARDLHWKYQLDAEKDYLSLILNNNEITTKYYPFSFELKIDVILKINSLNFIINIQNRSNSPMPSNFGLHPYFKISDFKNIKFSDYPLVCQNQKENSLEHTNDILNNISKGIDILMYSNGRSSFKDYGLKREITLINPKPIDISVIWSDPPRKMICMEPWTSPRNSLEDDYRILIIPPNSSQTFFTSIQIKDI